jgi:hypothetical protein
MDGRGELVVYMQYKTIRQFKIYDIIEQAKPEGTESS